MEMVIDRLNKVFCKVFKDDSIQLLEEMTSNDIEKWDSINHLILMVEIEKEFKFKFSTQDIRELKNVGDILKIIKSKS